MSPSVATLERLLASMGERLELESRPLVGNQRAADLRSDFHDLTMAQRMEQAAQLSYDLTTLAGRSRRR